MDDIIVCGSHVEEVDKFEKVLGSRFKITECGPLEWFLGMHVVQSAHEVIVYQSVYVKSVLRKYGMEDCRPAKTPDIYISRNCVIR